MMSVILSNISFFFAILTVNPLLAFIRNISSLPFHSKLSLLFPPYLTYILLFILYFSFISFPYINFFFSVFILHRLLYFSHISTYLALLPPFGSAEVQPLLRSASLFCLPSPYSSSLSLSYWPGQDSALSNLFPCLTTFSARGLLWLVFSVLFLSFKQMPGYNSNCTPPPSPITETFSQSDPDTSGFNSKKAVQPKSFSKRTSFMIGQSLTSISNP